MKNIILLLVCITTFGIQAQEATYQQDVIKYLEMNGTTEQYSGAIDQLFELLKRQYASQNIDSATWIALRDEAQSETGKIKALLVSAYRGTYEHEDIKNLIAFYETPTGKQLLTDQTALDDNQQNMAAAFYNTDTGQKVISKRQEISRSVSEVSEFWSRDLYRKMVDKLAEKGYTKQ